MQMSSIPRWKITFMSLVGIEHLVKFTFDFLVFTLNSIALAYMCGSRKLIF